MFGRNNYRGGGAAGNDSRPCKFFLEGRCKFGDDCKNYHPRNQSSDNYNQNRFAPLQNGNGFNNRGGNALGPPNGAKVENFAVTTEGIKADLTTERPIWPLSAYGPGINAPRQLLEGPLEQSFEEIRLLYYLAQASGTVPEYIQTEQNMLNKSNEQVQTILKDLDGARKYVIDAQHEHPNRHDAIIKAPAVFPRNNATLPTPPVQSGGFGRPSGLGATSSTPATGGNAFGRPSPLGGQGTAFGSPSPIGATSGFGKPSALGNAPSGFGKPSPLGNPTFGQPSAPNNSPGFGQPSQPSAFGAPSALGAPKPAFGQRSQPSPFGLQQAPSNSNPAFGQPTQPSGFGQPLSIGQTQTPISGGGFGQPSGLGSNTNRASPFAPSAPTQQIPPASPFANPGNAAKSNPFSQGNGIGNAFGAPSSQAPSGVQQATAQSPFASNGNTFGSANGLTSSAPQQNVSGLQNKQIFRDEDGHSYYTKPDPGDPRRQKQVRVWMPNGPPAAPHVEAQGAPEAYEGEQGEALKAVYEYATMNGTFKDGLMPEIPPMREWIDWDL